MTAISLVGINPNKSIYIHVKTCTSMLTVLFVVARNWKQPKSPTICD